MTLASLSKWATVLLAVLVGIGLWWQQQRPPQIPLHLAVLSCQPEAGNCIARIGDGRLHWSVEKPIPYLHTFQSEIRLQNIADKDVRRVSVDYVMQGMRMAANRSVFNRQSANRWQAHSVLPVCASGRKDWTAIIHVETRQGVWQTGFLFTVTKK